MASEMEKAGTVIQVDNYEEFEEKFVDVEFSKYNSEGLEYFVNPIKVSAIFISYQMLSDHQKESIKVSQETYKNFFTYLNKEMGFEIETVSDGSPSDVSLYFYTTVPSDTRHYLAKRLEMEFGFNWRSKLDELHYLGEGSFVYSYHKNGVGFGFTMFVDLNLPHDTLKKNIGRLYMKGIRAVPPRSHVLIEGEADTVFNQDFQGVGIGELDKILLRKIKKMNKVDR
jgi:hypothetical protein